MYCKLSFVEKDNWEKIQEIKGDASPSIIPTKKPNQNKTECKRGYLFLDYFPLYSVLSLCFCIVLWLEVEPVLIRKKKHPYIGQKWSSISWPILTFDHHEQFGVQHLAQGHFDMQTRGTEAVTAATMAVAVAAKEELRTCGITNDKSIKQGGWRWTVRRTKAPFTCALYLWIYPEFSQRSCVCELIDSLWVSSVTEV